MSTTQEKIAVMQAFIDGAAIESRSRSEADCWMRLGDPCWNWEMCEYRVKPVPRVVYFSDTGPTPLLWYDRTNIVGHKEIGRFVEDVDWDGK